MHEQEQEQEYEQNIADELPPPPRGILYEHPKAKDFLIVFLLLLLCLFFSLIFWFSNTYKNFLWASHDAIFDQHEYWRLFTALFTHADIKHLLSNLPLFIAFGWFLRTYFGFLAFPLAAVAAGALANYATLYFYAPHIRLIGASGMVYALVGLWIIFYLRYEVRYNFGMKLFRVLGVSMLLLLPTTYESSTSYLAHGFGFLFGIFFAGLLIAIGTYDKNQRDLQAEI